MTKFKTYLIFSILLVAGCVDESVLTKCPKYFRQNIGIIKREPLNPLGLFFKGMVNLRDPNGTIHLFALADDDILLEEAFHSFEIRAGYNRYPEWERFYKKFNNNSQYIGTAGNFLILACPLIEFIPMGDKINFRTSVSPFEDSASCFVALMNNKTFDNKILQKKIKAVENFINGGFENE